MDVDIKLIDLEVEESKRKKEASYFGVLTGKQRL